MTKGADVFTRPRSLALPGNTVGRSSNRTLVERGDQLFGLLNLFVGPQITGPLRPGENSDKPLGQSEHFCSLQDEIVHIK